MRVAFIGVHGIGKTETAKVLAEGLDWKYVPVEDEEWLERVVKMEPIRRQTEFMVRYLRVFQGSRDENAVFDSHPVLVAAYTRVVCPDLYYYHIKLMRKADVDVIVWLRPHKWEQVIERIEKRGRKVDIRDLAFLKRVHKSIAALMAYVDFARVIKVVAVDDPKRVAQKVAFKLWGVRMR